MDIFQVHGEVELPRFNLLLDVLQALQDSSAIILGDNPAFGEHDGMGNGPGNILMVHALVKVYGRLELIDHLINGLGKASAPHCLTHLEFFSCMRALTFRGRPKRLMKPVASAWS